MGSGSTHIFVFSGSLRVCVCDSEPTNAFHGAIQRGVPAIERVIKNNEVKTNVGTGDRNTSETMCRLKNSVNPFGTAVPFWVQKSSNSRG